jgi:hypothetical protein
MLSVGWRYCLRSGEGGGSEAVTVEKGGGHAIGPQQKLVEITLARGERQRTTLVFAPRSVLRKKTNSGGPGFDFRNFFKTQNSLYLMMKLEVSFKFYDIFLQEEKGERLSRFPSLTKVCATRRPGPRAFPGRCRGTGAATFDPARKAHLIFSLSTRPKPNRKREQTTGTGKGRERSTSWRHSSLPPSYSSSAPGDQWSAEFSVSAAPAARSWGRQGPRREWRSVPFSFLFSVNCRIFHLIISLALAISSFDLV